MQAEGCGAQSAPIAGIARHRRHRRDRNQKLLTSKDTKEHKWEKIYRPSAKDRKAAPELCNPCKKFVRPQPRGMIVNSRGDHQFVSTGLIDEFLESSANGLLRADKRAGQHAGNVCSFRR